VTGAGAVLTTERFSRHAPDGVAVLHVRKPYDAFVIVARKIYSGALRPISVFGTVGVASGAAVHPSAQLGRDVTVDPFAVIGPSAKIGAGTVIGAHAVIGPGVRIGSDCAIGANCTVTHAHLGDRVIIHSGCSIGQDGFGYVLGAEGHVKVPQVGRVMIHDDVEIGSGTRIDRGGIRDTVIGEGTKIDNLCQIGHNCVVGRHCIIVAQSGLSGSVTLEDFVVLGPRTGIIPHITVGKGAITASRATVYENIPAGACWGGFPAKPKRQWMREMVALRNLAARPRKNPRDTPSGT
jgi:UDP-3-O-[3-hydroxymyristoyl] glucosamine N-acyltransferase